MTEHLRISAIREKVREKADLGLLGPLAAQARVPEYVLRAWMENPLDVPTREMLVDIQNAVSEPIEIGPGTLINGKEID